MTDTPTITPSTDTLTATDLAELSKHLAAWGEADDQRTIELGYDADVAEWYVMLTWPTKAEHHDEPELVGITMPAKAVTHHSQSGVAFNGVTFLEACARAALAVWPTPDDDRHMIHLHGCHQCNYGKDCFACDVGHDDIDETDPRVHACNCPKSAGTDRGYDMRIAAEAETAPVIRIRRLLGDLKDVTW